MSSGRLPWSATLLAVFALGASPAGAQVEHEFIIDRPASHWNWSALVQNLGYIIGIPETTFDLDGRVWVELTEAGGVIQDGSFVVMVAPVVPQLRGYIPGTPGYPNLLDIWTEDLVFSVDSPVFPVSPDGSYTADITVAILSGTLHTVFLGNETIMDLSTIMSAPNPMDGTVTMGTDGLHFDGFMIALFDFYDPVSGLSATFNMSGWLIGDVTCSTGPVNVCSTKPNSTEAPAHISAVGSYNVANNSLELYAAPVPNEFGIFFYSPTLVNGGAGFPLGNGRLCIGPGTIHRLYPPILGSGHVMARALDLTSPPSPAGQITPGSTWYFQTWFRDPSAGGGGFNLSNAVEVPFCL
jgi:hypothetical protein